jgi:hypothetical protein
MDEWNGEWSSRDELMIERTLKTWTDFEQWVIERKANRAKAVDDYLKERHGRVGTSTSESGAEATSS